MAGSLIVPISAHLYVRFSAANYLSVYDFGDTFRYQVLINIESAALSLKNNV